jgi:hypothetical protein
MKRERGEYNTNMDEYCEYVALRIIIITTSDRRRFNEDNMAQGTYTRELTRSLA